MSCEPIQGLISHLHLSEIHISLNNVLRAYYPILCPARLYQFSLLGHKFERFEAEFLVYLRGFPSGLLNIIRKFDT